MKERIQFRKMVEGVIRELDPVALNYNEEEMWMLHSPYEYLEYYGFENKLVNTSIALPLARGLHDGTYRKSLILKDGVWYRRPYVIHCLLVCRMLADLSVPISKDEEDIMLAAALCHDMIEDIPFEDHGKEMYTRFGLDKRVYETVQLVSKRKDFTKEQERAHFQEIQKNKLALLVKLSDRSNNVEDLYNMPVKKIHEYVDETRTYILPMCDYGMEHYKELRTTLAILRDKITCLTEAAEILVNRYEAREKELREELEALKEENERLFKIVGEIWKG